MLCFSKLKCCLLFKITSVLTHYLPPDRERRKKGRKKKAKENSKVKVKVKGK